MPAKSKAQYRFMQGVAHGTIEAEGLSKKKAAEYVRGQSPRGLVERVRRKLKKIYR